MSNMKALSQSVERELKFIKNIIKVGQSQGHQVLNLGMCEKVLSQAIHMPNSKALSQSIERELKLFKKQYVKGQSQCHQVKTIRMFEKVK